MLPVLMFLGQYYSIDQVVTMEFESCERACVS